MYVVSSTLCLHEEVCVTFMFVSKSMLTMIVKPLKIFTYLEVVELYILIGTGIV